MKLKKGRKVVVSYFEHGVPEYCYYKGPGVFMRYVRKNESEWDDPMCVVKIPEGGECFFPVSDVIPAPNDKEKSCL